MTTWTRPWPIRLAAAAESDFQEILQWTAKQFGEQQALLYADTLIATLEDLTTGPTVLGAKDRSDVAKGLFTLHVARHGRKGRHFVIFRVGRDKEGEVIEVLRVLHDAIDLPRHLSSKRKAK